MCFPVYCVAEIFTEVRMLSSQPWALRGRSLTAMSTDHKTHFIKTQHKLKKVKVYQKSQIVFVHYFNNYQLCFCRNKHFYLRARSALCVCANVCVSASLSGLLCCQGLSPAVPQGSKRSFPEKTQDSLHCSWFRRSQSPVWLKAAVPTLPVEALEVSLPQPCSALSFCHHTSHKPVLGRIN